MNNQYEIIQFGERIPMKLFCNSLNQIAKHRHKDLEIILILKGKAHVVFADMAMGMSEDDLIVINANSLHELKSEQGCIMISLQIDTDEVDGIQKDAHFNCNSALDNDKGRYYTLKRLIAELVKTNSDITEANFYFNQSMIYSIFYELFKNFQSEKSSTEIGSQKYLERLNRIVNYIDEHYAEGLTLNNLAEIEHLSVPYLSSFFEKYLGVNFMTYYNELRLARAVNELLTSDDSVETIALNNGFGDPRSFVNLFKKKYSTLPSLYRKNPKKQIAEPFVQSDHLDDPELDRESYLRILAKYLPKPGETSGNNPSFSDNKMINKEQISILHAPKVLKHTFKVFTSVGRAKELLYADVQKMLTELQATIGYEYIKFHGLLSDDMLVYEEDEDGKPYYSFVYIDKIIDFLLSIKLKPLVQFSFMPKDLASDKNRNVYAAPFNISLPTNMEKWQQLIRTLILHLIDRYGLKVVKSWLFCVWNEPDTTENLFGFQNDADYYSLYQATYTTVKSINKSFSFGSPSLLVSYNLNQRWCERFIVWCGENSCVPDFMNIHYYDNDFSEDSIELHRPAHPAHSRLNRDENSFSKCIAQMKILFADLGIENIPVYLTEWNLTVSHRNLLNDTCFKSCYLTKNLLENYDQLDSFGYWVLTDMIEETLPSKEQFHGGLGVYTMSGIKKPHYYVFDFLNRLGDRLIEKGDGYFITKSYGKIQIILYNYEHFNHLFASGETYDMTFTERYTPFSQLGKMDISLELIDMPVKSCVIREHVLNQSSGSAFDEWVRMGAGKLTNEDIDYLKRVSVPKLYMQIAVVENGVLSIDAALEPLEVRFIEIKL